MFTVGWRRQKLKTRRRGGSVGPRGREKGVIHYGVVAVTVEGREAAPPGLGRMQLLVTRAVPAQARGRGQQKENRAVQT